MATSWTLTANQICRDALEHLGAAGEGETVSAGDQNLALRALDAVLKELPLSGYSWPKLSGEVALAWNSVSPQAVTLPTDYYAYPAAWKTVNDELVPLTQIPHAEWVTMAGKENEAQEPTHFYISPSKVLHFWPEPTQDPGAKLQYQKIVDDAQATSAPDMPQYWINALGYGVASELRFKFGIDTQKRNEIKMQWEEKKTFCLANSIPSEPISFSVAD
jgi:hypothetical protein